MPQCTQCGGVAPAASRFCNECGAAIRSTSEPSTVILLHGTATRTAAGSTVEEGRFPPGTLLSQRYRISGLLGKGGMGEVYRATDLLVGQTVALKFLPESMNANEAAIGRFRNEVRLARQISHPNVCRVYDIGEAEGHLFLSMEFIDGEDLASLLRRIGRLPAAKALEIAKRLCGALAAAHDKGVLHRDLKPRNIMIDGRGNVLITDFGLATAASECRPADVQSGTPAYMSPEQLAGVGVTERSDIYALGLVLYELFGGVPAYSDGSRAQLMKVRQSAPPSLLDVAPDVDPAIEQVVARCLDPNPSHRPGSALAVARSLPGGDPLAAALAMGETPSPELVATAEPSGIMRPGMLSVVFWSFVAVLLANAWLLGRFSIFSPFAHDMDPRVMADAARRTLGALGYASTPGWSAAEVALDSGIMQPLLRYDRDTIRKAVAQQKPVYFWYRSSPEPMSSSNPFNPQPSEQDPRLGVPGMIQLRLDSDRRLVSLAAVPEQKAGASAPTVSWAPLFSAAGLDTSRFAPADPLWTPPGAFDARASWLEKDGSDPLRVEAATWKGRPVFFRVARTSAALDTPPSQYGSSGTWFAVYIGALLALISGFAWHNLRKGRGDLRSAVRFGSFMAAASLVRGLLLAEHAGGLREFYILVNVAGLALWSGTTIAVGYLAIEPHVRRRWPNALLSSSRLLSGKFADKLVGQHVLLGLLVGAGIAATVNGSLVIRFGELISWSPLISSSLSSGVQGILGASLSAASEPPWLFCLLFVLITITRKRWIGVALTSLILTAVVLGGDFKWIAIVPLAVITAFLVFVTRYGLLPMIVAWFAQVIGRDFPLTLDTSAFYFGVSCTGLVTLLGLGVYAYRNAIAEGTHRRSATSAAA